VADNPWLILAVVIALLVLVTLGALASASETALFSISSPRARALRNAPDSRDQLVSQLLSRPRDLMVSILIVNIAINVLTQDFFAILGGEDSGWLFSVILPLLVTVIFGELVPKALALANGLLFARRVAPILAKIAALLGPIRAPVVSLATWISRILFPFLRPSAALSIVELEQVVELSGESGVLRSDEADLCRGVLSLQDGPTKNFMTPLDEVVYWYTHESEELLWQRLRANEDSYVVIANRDMQRPQALLSAEIASRYYGRPVEDWLGALEGVAFLPETMTAMDSLSMLQSRQLGSALCVDEYGSITGLISYTRLIEEAIGIPAPLEDNEIIQAGYQAFVADGRAELAAIERLLHMHLPNEHQRVTIGGWLTDQMGTIPEAGDEWRGAGVYVQVLAAEPTRVTRIYLRRDSGKPSVQV